MGVFQEAKFNWQEKEYVIPPDKIMGAIATVEQHLTLKEITEQLAAGGRIRLVPIAMAYHALMRYAGCDDPGMTIEAVYGEMFGKSNGDTVFGHTSALVGLLGLMIPPAQLTKRLEKEGIEIKKDGPAVTAKNRSKKRTRPPSA